MNKLQSKHGKEGSDFRRTIIQYKLNNQDMRQTQSNKQYANNLTALINSCLEDEPLKLEFQELCYLYKKLAQRLAYLVTFLKYISPHYQQSLSDLNSLTRTVEILVRSTQYQKYGHTLPLFQFVANKFLSMNITNFISFDQQALINRIFLNQASPLYFNIKESPISKNSLYSQNFQSFFRQLNQNQRYLNNPQCIGCSPVFLKHSQIINRNPLFCNILIMSFKENLTDFRLASNICSLLNSGGGCILIGPQKKQNQIYTKGFCFRQEEEINKKQAMIAHAVSSIRPKFYYLFQKVLIDSNPFEEIFDEICFCFRIIIFPILKQYTAFVEVQEGNELFHNFFRLNNQNKPEQIAGKINGISQQCYLFAHAHYKKLSKPERTSHKNIMCLNSHHLKSGVKNEIPSVPCNNKKKMDDEQVEVKNKEDQLRFPYERTSLLVLPSSKFNKEVQVFQKELKKRGYLVQLSYPFRSYTGNSTINKRPVWMLSHQIHGNELKNILKGMQGDEIVGSKIIKILPVYKTLQLEKQKLPEQKFKKFRKKFYDKFHHPFHEDLQKTSVKKGKVEQIFYFTFQDYNEAIFAYILLEDLQVRPYFVREGGIYKLKET